MPSTMLEVILNEIENARSIRQKDEAKFHKMIENARLKLINLSEQYPESAKIFYECASTHDMLGLEKEAVPYYEKAIALGNLQIDDLHGAYLGLGSTYRCIGMFEKSISVLNEGISLFPDDHSLRVFLALSKYSAKDFEGSVQILLDSLVETSTCENIRRYSRAIRYYRDHLDDTSEL
ncbi:MAG TPA: tetratricopeptide repeat protein [Candidatus Bathyarchaeia archaeon]|nr:tetratricopeptide repeat protein [Candidatus Bathyarchaeia archaeon]